MAVIKENMRCRAATIHKCEAYGATVKKREM